MLPLVAFGLFASLSVPVRAAFADLRFTWDNLVPYSASFNATLLIYFRFSALQG